MFLGAGAIEFILCHAEVEIAFVEEKKIGEVHCSTGTPTSLTICYNTRKHVVVVTSVPNYLKHYLVISKTFLSLSKFIGIYINICNTKFYKIVSYYIYLML